MSLDTPPTNCPDCGGNIIEKKGVGKKGEYHFWGCSNFASKGCTFSWSPAEVKEKPGPIATESGDVEATLKQIKYVLLGPNPNKKLKELIGDPEFEGIVPIINRFKNKDKVVVYPDEEVVET